ncbi:MAG: hypothetical protein AAF078_02295 [Planctomycetota bacterium]
MTDRPAVPPKLVLLLTALAAGCAFMSTGLAIASGDAVSTVLSLTTAICFMIVFGYRAARTQWVEEL